MTTLRDLIRFTMPPGSRLLTGEEGMHVHVRAVAGLRATLPAFPELRGGELTLISPAQAIALDDRLTLSNIISRLAEVPVAAVAIAGSVDTTAQSLAHRTGLAIVELPSQADLRAIERDGNRLITDPDLQIERWASQLYSDLTQCVVAGAGVTGVIERLAERTGVSAAVYSPGGKLRAQQAHGPARAAFELLRPEMPEERHRLGLQIHVEHVGDHGLLVLANAALDRWDRLAARQGAAALALELTKEQAVRDAETRVRGDLVRAILSGTPMDAESLAGQAAELGYRLDHPHIAVVVAPQRDELPAALQPSLERILAQRKIIAPILLREDSVLVFVPAASGMSSPDAIVETLRESHAITAGISGVAPTHVHWPGALDEAEQALALGRQLFGPGSVTAFADLGVYRLLLAQRDSPELWRFYRDILGPLLDHGASGADLIETLEGYFRARGNVSKAATLLHVHRNTLIYRLQRISEIIGIDWERSEDLLALQLALRAHRVLRMIEGTTARP